MGADLTTISSEELKSLVANMPANKRAAWSKAAKAAAQHLKDTNQNYSKAYELASAMVENWWRLGLELPRLGISQGSGMKKRNRQGDNVFTIEQLGINASQSQRCQKLAEMSKSELDEWLDLKYDEQKQYLPALTPASDGSRHSTYSGECEWYTPKDYVDRCRNVLGGIDLDPASTAAAQETVKAASYFTAQDNSLEQEWSGRVFLNPPYKMPLVENFVGRLCDDYQAKVVKSAILLTNNSTDAKWWQHAAGIASEICFTFGRICFNDRNGEANKSPTNGQTFMYFGGRHAAFKKQFENVGWIARSVQ